MVEENQDKKQQDESSGSDNNIAGFDDEKTGAFRDDDIDDENPLDNDHNKETNQHGNHFQLFPGNKELQPGDEGFDETNAHVSYVVNEWAQGTSIHGVAYISDYSWKVWKRMLWLVLVCVSGAILVWQIEALIREYRSYEVLTDTETVVPDEMIFPEITICNENALSQARKEYYGIEEPRNESELRLLSQPLDFEDFWYNPNAEGGNFFEQYLPGFILGATFNNANEDLPLNNETWKERITPFGRCWSFLANETVLRPGIQGGLETELFLDQNDYNINGTGFASALIFAQQPGTQISNQLPYVAASPGRQTVITVQMTDIAREKEAPWARCNSEAPLYTQSQCRVDCLNAGARKVCGCREWGDVMQMEDLPLCTDEENGDCVDAYFANETQILKTCECSLPPCSSINYEMTTTEQQMARWQLESLIEGTPFTEDFFLDSWVGLRINFDKIQYNHLTESKAVTFAQLLGSVGGSMGLFLGISALSFFEVIGDLALMRLIPRMFGYRHLHGIGART